ncbi:hypothetical protein RO3G_11906 [Rhizopus delemar RA 99-880]|uniref:Arrestin C-terminal-like domain-containing protein n=1 Tax=Rhizopus delemar (strain RA 99-880 / ATCC MYA-4621 / FGSC 9543 / NRRL 43880) TaxID=246409 RepID=I1CFG5_RHIO9|nr:hypothetical protein RO3G_11906 [Rhizopus delemar RA 99-880]|eukprot:EIE87195.1 hypothetical protein RO3G_11906 [Rhizopus delemar RA 99-880]
MTLEDIKRRRIAMNQSDISATVKLSAVEYIAGDTIQATVYVTEGQKKKSKRSLTLNDLSISMRVYQISKFNLDEKPILSQLMATNTYILKNNKLDNDENKMTQVHQVSLELDEELAPSMEYSQIMSLSYKLVISIHKTIYNKTDNPVPHPKFLQTIEYEDALPLYDSSRLPLYDNLSRSNICAE